MLPAFLRPIYESEKYAVCFKRNILLLVFFSQLTYESDIFSGGGKGSNPGVPGRGLVIPLKEKPH